jgi:hypothetical protein
MKKQIDQIRELRGLQGAAIIQAGEIFDSSYFIGLYNGLEMALSILESREPVYQNQNIESNKMLAKCFLCEEPLYSPGQGEDGNLCGTCALASPSLNQGEGGVF